MLTLGVKRALDPSSAPTQAAGLALAGTLLAPAIVEHWLLILPLDATALWRWAMQKHVDSASNTGSSRPAGAATPSPESNRSDEKPLHPR